MSRAAQFYGAGDVDRIFGGAPQSSVPWHVQGPTRTHRVDNPMLIHEAVNDPERRHVTSLDPRELWASQSGLQRAATDYYTNGSRYRDTGETFADQHQAGNVTPVVFHNEETGRLVIRSGHHRAAAALLRGEQFHPLLVSGSPATHTDARAFQDYVDKQRKMREGR